MLSESMIYRAAAYLRLSKEDGDFSLSPGKRESNSISSQRDLVRDHVRKCPDIELVTEFVDDGVTGTTFNRPNFKKMMEAAERGEINCIIVKDLSRFGREYIDAGQYIEKFFPQKGIRFIAVNDHYDSLASHSASDSLIIPFKNLINDSYSRDISIKIRTNLEAKRKRGEFISNFAAFGYRKDPTDRNRLIVDEEAAAVVRDIFAWRVAGFSPSCIAKRLAERGILSPSAYKKAHGLNYRTSFQTKGSTQWTTVAVNRILTNEVYCGVLIQGRRTTANYKVKSVIVKDEQDWVRVENAHEALIDRNQFQVVQRLMREGSRSFRGREGTYPLAGRVFCGLCGKSVKRTFAYTGGKRYVYYTCPESGESGCAVGSISERDLEAAVLNVLNIQIAAILDMERIMSAIDALAWENREIQKLNALIDTQESQIKRSSELKVSAYEDFREGMIDRDDLTQIKDELTSRIHSAELTIRELRRQREELKDGVQNRQGWLAQFRAYRSMTVLDRAVVVTLIDRVLLLPGKEIRVELRQRDQLRQAAEFLDSQGLGDQLSLEGVV